MSSARRTPAPAASLRPTDRRVREQARDALAVMAFSALTSSTLVGALLLVLNLGR